jgi:hypothetical protein
MSDRGLRSLEPSSAPLLDSDLDFVYYTEGELFVAYSPSLDLLAHGVSEEDAGKNLRFLLGLPAMRDGLAVA